MSEEIKFIEVSLQKVSVKPGDVIVFSCPEKLPEKTIEYITEQGKKFFPKNLAIILEDGMKLGVVEKEKYKIPDIVINNKSGLHIKQEGEAEFDGKELIVTIVADI